jgi:hypothetical protein
MPAVHGVIAVIRTVAPQVARVAGPELTKWLAKAKNRQALAEALKRSTSRLPTDRLRARIETTILVLESIKQNAPEPQRAAFADQAQDRARRLLIKLDLPLGTRAERKENTKAVATALTRLHADMNRELDEPGSGGGGGELTES